MKILGKFVCLTSLVLLIFFVYAKLTSSFFQQDEWLAFGKYYSLQPFTLWEILKYAFRPDLGHYVPFARLSFLAAFSIFKLNYLLWTMASICAHLLVVVALYFLALEIFRDKKLAFCTAILFGTSGFRTGSRGSGGSWRERRGKDYFIESYCRNMGS